MSNTTWKKYPATINWAKVYEDNRDMGPQDDSDIGKKLTESQGQYTLDMLVDGEIKEQMIKDGIPEVVLGYPQFHSVEDEDDLWKYRAKRPHFKPNWKNKGTGEMGVVMGPPTVIDYNASKEAEELVYLSNLIGNGSKGLVKLSIYKGRATIVGLEGVAITELVEFVPEGDGVFF